MGAFDSIRSEILAHARKMWREGLVVASAGNISARVPGADDAVAVTPTSIPWDVMTAEQIAIVSLRDGSPIDAPAAPTSELPMHLAVLRARPDVGAVVHTHAPHVSVLSVLRRPLPPVIDEMMIYFGGTIEVADYAFTGGERLGGNVVAALADRAGAILSNHGNVCVGSTLDEALHVAITMEACARTYVAALALGAPAALPPDAVAAGRKLYEARRRLT